MYKQFKLKYHVQKVANILIPVGGWVSGTDSDNRAGLSSTGTELANWNSLVIIAYNVLHVMNTFTLLAMRGGNQTCDMVLRDFKAKISIFK